MVTIIKITQEGMATAIHKIASYIQTSGLFQLKF